MSHELDKILISYKQLDFQKTLSKLRFAVVHAARFKIDSKENKQLRSIIEDVMKRGDAAVSEYTEKFDGVKLTPEQFEVNRDDLEKAHKEIDAKLLDSLRKAIQNVQK